jgi:hypothetical protein
MAGSLVWVIVIAIPTMTPLYAEAHLNGKQQLCQYYVRQTFRFIYLTLGGIVAALVVVVWVLPTFIVAFGIQNYAGIVPFLLPLIVRFLFVASSSHADQLLVGTDQSGFLLRVRLVEEVLKLITILVAFWGLRLPETFGYLGVVYLFVFWDFPAIMVKTLLSYRYLNRNLFPIRISGFQTFVGPGAAALTITILGLLIKVTVFDMLMAWIGFWVAAVVFALLLVVLLLYVYFPLTVFFGAWDADSLRVFRLVAKISGPSRFLVQPMFRLMTRVAKVSALHNRFPIPAEQADQETTELWHLKLAANVSLRPQ